VQAECVSMAETYCIADFPPEVSVAFCAVPNATCDLMPGEHWVFLRWGPEPRASAHSAVRVRLEPWFTDRVQSHARTPARRPRT
jgi:hypothetical protein